MQHFFLMVLFLLVSQGTFAELPTTDFNTKICATYTNSETAVLGSGEIHPSHEQSFNLCYFPGSEESDSVGAIVFYGSTAADKEATPHLVTSAYSYSAFAHSPIPEDENSDALNLQITYIDSQGTEQTIIMYSFNHDDPTGGISIGSEHYTTYQTYQ